MYGGDTLTSIEGNAAFSTAGLAVVGARHPFKWKFTTGSKVAFFDTATELDALAQEPRAVLVSGADARSMVQQLKALRASPRQALWPAFIDREWSETAVDLSDGVFADYRPAVLEADKISTILAELPRDRLQDNKDLRLLGFLLSRQGRVLRPLRRWRHPRVWYYPVVEAMAGDSHPHVWLKNLQDKGLLAPADLLDRLRHCPKCDSPHLSFVDVCPNCQGLNIESKSFLHCFTCGNVAPKERFLTTGALVCPRCDAKLRHIGSDYDRPLENKVCNGCGFIFNEAEVRANCLACDAVNPPEQLVARPVHVLTLTETGRLTAKHGDLENIYALLDDLHYVRPTYFTSMVDWMLAMSRRYPEELFSIIGLRLTNVAELTDALGHDRVSALLEGFAERIRAILRTTDLTTRTAEHDFWLLLPRTDLKGREVVLGRIMDIRAATKQPEGLELRLENACFTAPEDALGGEDAELVMARLAGSMQ